MRVAYWGGAGHRGLDSDVSKNRASAIVAAKGAITADTAMRLAAYRGTSARYWLNLQSAHDRSGAERRPAESVIWKLKVGRSHAGGRPLYRVHLYTV